MVKMWTKLAVGVALAVIVVRVCNLVVFLGFHSHVYNQKPGPCRKLPVIEHGSEDLQLLPDGKVLMTSGLHVLKEGNAAFDGVRGKIYLFDMTVLDAVPEELEIRGKADADDLDPQGISAWVDPKTGIVTVFVVNHQYIHIKSSMVDRFKLDMDKKVLHFQETIGKEDTNFRFLNDVVAVGENQFYFTNCFYYISFVEMFLQIRWGYIGFYDGEKSHVAMGGLLSPNGINISPDLKYVYTAQTFDKAISIYERAADNSLTLVEAKALYAIADNIHVDGESGDLIVGLHPVPWILFQYMDDTSVLSPSQVLRMKVKDGHVTSITQVMADDGSFISASAGAVNYKGRYLIGSIFTNNCLCEDRT